MKMLIKNALIISPYFKKGTIGSIYIEDSTIKKIEEKIEVKCDVVYDAEGKYVLPGFIDMHCKICQTGYENKNNIILVSRGAAAGGYTTITSHPNTQPIIDNKTVVEYVYSKSREYSKVNIFPYGSITKGCLGNEIAEIGGMILAGVVALSDGGTSIENAELLRDIFMYSKMFDVPIITYCQDKNISGSGVINSGYMSTKLGLNGAPREAEEIIVARNLILAKYADARLHITHVTTKGSVELIRYAKKMKVNVTCGTCPHYFSLSENAVDEFNTFAKVKPPLRTDEDIEAIKIGIKDGTIDVISSGHTPVTIDKKNTEFDNAAYGISALQTSFPISYINLVDENNFSIYDLVEKMSYNPSKILGLSKKGCIKEENDADLIIVDIDESYKIDASQFLSKAKYSPFDKLEVKGKIIKTIVKGKIIQ